MLDTIKVLFILTGASSYLVSKNDSTTTTTTTTNHQIMSTTTTTTTSNLTIELNQMSPSSLRPPTPTLSSSLSSFTMDSNSTNYLRTSKNNNLLLSSSSSLVLYHPLMNDNDNKQLIKQQQQQKQPNVIINDYDAFNKFNINVNNDNTLNMVKLNNKNTDNNEYSDNNNKKQHDKLINLTRKILMNKESLANFDNNHRQQQRQQQPHSSSNQWKSSTTLSSSLNNSNECTESNVNNDVSLLTGLPPLPTLQPMIPQPYSLPKSITNNNDDDDQNLWVDASWSNNSANSTSNNDSDIDDINDDYDAGDTDNDISNEIDNQDQFFPRQIARNAVGKLSISSLMPVGQISGDHNDNNRLSISKHRNKKSIPDDQNRNQNMNTNQSTVITDRLQHQQQQQRRTNFKQNLLMSLNETDESNELIPIAAAIVDNGSSSGGSTSSEEDSSESSSTTTTIASKTLATKQQSIKQPVYEVIINEEENDLPKKLFQIKAIMNDTNGEPILLNTDDNHSKKTNQRKKLMFILSGNGVDYEHPENSKFAINTMTGELFLIKALNRDPPDGREQYRLTIQVETDDDDHGYNMNDNNNNRINQSVIVIVHVKDINDNRPYFERSEYDTQVRENLGSGIDLLRLSAIDLDPESIVRYSIEVNRVNSDGELIFDIDELSGLLSTAVCCLDRESIQQYIIKICASDLPINGNDGHHHTHHHHNHHSKHHNYHGQSNDQSSLNTNQSSCTNVRINITDDNDEPPKFIRNYFYLSLFNDHYPPHNNNPSQVITKHLYRNRILLNTTIIDKDLPETNNFVCRLEFLLKFSLNLPSDLSLKLSSLLNDNDNSTTRKNESIHIVDNEKLFWSFLKNETSTNQSSMINITSSMIMNKYFQCFITKSANLRLKISEQFTEKYFYKFLRNEFDNYRQKLFRNFQQIIDQSNTYQLNDKINYKDLIQSTNFVDIFIKIYVSDLGYFDIPTNLLMLSQLSRSKSQFNTHQQQQFMPSNRQSSNQLHYDDLYGLLDTHIISAEFQLKLPFDYEQIAKDAENDSNSDSNGDQFDQNDDNKIINKQRIDETSMMMINNFNGKHPYYHHSNSNSIGSNNNHGGDETANGHNSVNDNLNSNDSTNAFSNNNNSNDGRMSKFFQSFFDNIYKHSRINSQWFHTLKSWIKFSIISTILIVLISITLIIIVLLNRRRKNYQILKKISNNNDPMFQMTDQQQQKPINGSNQSIDVAAAAADEQLINEHHSLHSIENHQTTSMDNDHLLPITLLSKDELITDTIDDQLMQQQQQQLFYSNNNLELDENQQRHLSNGHHHQQQPHPPPSSSSLLSLSSSVPLMKSSPTAQIEYSIYDYNDHQQLQQQQRHHPTTSQQFHSLNKHLILLNNTDQQQQQQTEPSIPGSSTTTMTNGFKSKSLIQNQSLSSAYDNAGQQPYELYDLAQISTISSSSLSTTTTSPPPIPPAPSNNALSAHHKLIDHHLNHPQQEFIEMKSLMIDNGVGGGGGGYIQDQSRFIADPHHHHSFNIVLNQHK